MADNFLIIGGTGFIGYYVVSELVASHGAQFVRVLSGRQSVESPIIPGPEYIEGDLTNVDVLRSAVHGVSVVIHLAGDIVPATSNEDISLDITQNLLPFIRLLEICREAKIRKLIYESSGGAIYGNPKYIPVDEDHPTCPLTSYGVVKRASELYLGMFGLLGGLSSLALRIANPYGPGQAGNGTHGFVGTAVACALSGQPLTILGDGTTARDFVFVTDVAQAIAKAGCCDASGVVNIGTGRSTTQLEVIEIIERVTGRQITLRFEAARSCDVQAICLDGKRVKLALGWTASTALETGIKRTVEGYRFHRATHLFAPATNDAA